MGAPAFALAGGLTGSASLTAAARRKERDPEAAREALGAAAGGWAAQGAYQGAGYAAKWRAQVKHGYGSRGQNRQAFLDGPDGKKIFRTKAQTDKRLSRQEKAIGHRRGTPEFDRRYPKTLPEWKTHRTLGWTHRGRTGTAIGGALTALGTYGGAELASSKSSPLRRREVAKGYRSWNPRSFDSRSVSDGRTPKAMLREAGHPAKDRRLRFTGRDDLMPIETPMQGLLRDRLKRGVAQRGGQSVPATSLRVANRDRYARIEVGKAQRTFGYLERERNVRRTTQQAVGLGLVAWGAPRLPLGRQVARGVRMAAERGQGARAESAVRVGRRVRDDAARVTGQAENVLRGRVPGFGTALDTVPAKMRPQVVTGAGALLALKARPTHDERFVPYGGR